MPSTQKTLEDIKSEFERVFLGLEKLGTQQVEAMKRAAAALNKQLTAYSDAVHPKSAVSSKVIKQEFKTLQGLVSSLPTTPVEARKQKDKLKSMCQSLDEHIKSVLSTHPDNKKRGEQTLQKGNENVGPSTLRKGSQS